MKVLFCTLLFVLFVAGSMVAEPEPATPQPPAAQAAFFCSLADKAELPVTKALDNPLGWQQKSATDWDCEALASDCLRANCQCSEDCNGSVAQAPCTYYPRQWTYCLCA